MNAEVEKLNENLQNRCKVSPSLPSNEEVKNLETEEILKRLECLAIEEKEELFIPLTTEQLNKIDEALNPTGSREEVLVDEFHVQIKRGNLQKLAGSSWLNDEIIIFYLNLIADRNCKLKLSSVFVFETFFFPKLAKKGHKSVAKWTRNVDIFEHDLILIPVHLGVHWCLAVVDFRNKTIFYYDSMGGRNQTCLDLLLQYLKDERLDKKKQIFDSTEWKTNLVLNIPQQMNCNDCGVFVCKFAEYISRNAKLNFTQEHIPYFRKRMVYEILTKSLL